MIDQRLVPAAFALDPPGAVGTMRAKGLGIAED